MPYMMNGMWDGGYGYGFPFFNWGLVLLCILIFLIIAFLVYQDANKRGQNGLLWGILVLIPMIGIIFLILYIVIRETGPAKTGPGAGAMEILKIRFAKGEITAEEFRAMSEELKK